jgi:glycosyltransferase involved in cell wall biosynthesis
MAKVSIVIPARNEPWLEKTVDDIFEKAVGEIEVIVVLDGYWPETILKDRPNLTIIHRSEAQGMRHAINSAASIATGKYYMKVDAHCMFAEGFDEELQKEDRCQYDQLSVPSRWSLNAEEWTRNYGPIEYNYVTYPYLPDNQFGDGLHGKKWLGEEGNAQSLRPKNYYWMERARKDIKIDEIQTWQGSCWFMHLKRFWEFGGMDLQFTNIHQEAQELGFKTWLSGGSLIRNKHTWYAHWHKSENRRGYRLSLRAMRETQSRSTWYWMNNKWEGQTRQMEWFIDHFWPIPGWPENWREEKIKYETEHPYPYE